MYEDINNQIQERIVYSIIFEISYAKGFAIVRWISQMHYLFNFILIDQPIIEL